MANPVEAKYTVQIGPTYTVDTAAELTGWAAVQGRSVSELTREATEYGLAMLREGWKLRHGSIPAEVLDAATADVKARGDRQAERKRKVARDAAAAKAARDAKPVRRRSRADSTSG